MKNPPRRPTVTVPRNRKVSPERREDIDVRWRDLRTADLWRGRVTLPGPTVIDCARTRPFDEALAIADSALRHGDVTSDELLRLAEQVPTSGRAACLRVAREANGEADNPFESVLRAIALDVPGLDVTPQVLIAEGGFVGRPDLVDVERRLVVEAESFEFHGKRRGLVRDCERYNALVRRGWLVLRFTWEHVMFDPAYVAGCLHDTAALRPLGRRQQPRRRRQGPLGRAPVPGSGQIPA